MGGSHNMSWTNPLRGSFPFVPHANVVGELRRYGMCEGTRHFRTGARC